MSNTDGEDTQRIKLTPRDAGYKYFTCPMCDGHGQIGQDQHDQNNRDVECQIETVQELASLREQLKQKEEVIRELIPIAQWGYDLLVPFDKERMGKEWPAAIEKAKSLTTKDK